MAEPILDWRSVSQHYVQELVERAVDQQQLCTRFAPSLLLAAHDDALGVAGTLAAVLKARAGTSVPILTPRMEIFDPAAHPYNPFPKGVMWSGGS
jgi:hypothetical protein